MSSELEYGINVANKFDLLFGDEDPTEALAKAAADKKKKPEEKQAAKAGAAVLKEKTARSAKAPVAAATDDGKAKQSRVEGKGPRTDAQGGARNGQNTRTVPGGNQQQQQRPVRSAGPGGPAGFGKENNSDNRRPPKDQQQRSPAAGGPQSAGPRHFGGPRPEGGAPRRPTDQEFSGAAGDQEVPEQRVGFGGNRGYRGGGGHRDTRHFGTRDAGDGQPAHARGREYDRHSGSNKTGVKPMAKKEGGGSHNWGNLKDEAEMGAEATETKVEGAVEGGEGAPAPVEAEPVVDQEAVDDAKKMTLKEWMEQQERDRLRPKYNTRAANDGEQEQKLFQKMKKVTKEKASADGMVEVVEYVEVDVDHPSGSGKGGLGGPFQLVFSAKRGFDEDGERGGRGDRGGRGGRGGPRGGRGGPRGGSAYTGGRGGPRGGRGHSEKPPAVDELNFPALG